MTLRPPWAFRNQRDRREFEDWLIKQLDASYEPSEDDIWREAQNDERYADEVARDLGRRLKRGKVMLASDAVARDLGRRLKRDKVIKAAEVKNRKALRRLTADDPALKDLALDVLTHRRKQRAHGDARPRDLSAEERAFLEDALAELELIRLIMKRQFNGFKGSGKFALEFVARRAAIEVVTERTGMTTEEIAEEIAEQIFSYRKSRPGKKRLKSTI
jgi:hypothetical protein